MKKNNDKEIGYFKYYDLKGNLIASNTIKEENGKFVVARYRYYVPVEIHRLNDISNYNVGWKYIGDSHDDEIQHFQTYESAVEYIKYKK